MTKKNIAFVSAVFLAFVLMLSEKKSEIWEGIVVQKVLQNTVELGSRVG